MTFAEIRKAVIAILGGITSVVPQVLASLGGIIPVNVASWLTIIAATATAILVYLVPNAPADPLSKVRTSIDALGPVFDVIRQRVREEVAARVPEPQWIPPPEVGASPAVRSHVREPEIRPDPVSLDPFVVRPFEQ